MPGPDYSGYANQAAYQNYLNWFAQTGGDWSWWSDAAAQAAIDAGLQQYSDNYLAGLLQERMHPWGENYHVNTQTGGIESIINPNYTAFLQNYMATHGPGNAATNVGSPSFYAQFLTGTDEDTQQPAPPVSQPVQNLYDTSRRKYDEEVFAPAQPYGTQSYGARAASRAAPMVPRLTRAANRQAKRASLAPWERAALGRFLGG